MKRGKSTTRGDFVFKNGGHWAGRGKQMQLRVSPIPNTEPLPNTEPPLGSLTLTIRQVSAVEPTWFGRQNTEPWGSIFGEGVYILRVFFYPQVAYFPPKCIEIQENLENGPR